MSDSVIGMEGTNKQEKKTTAKKAIALILWEMFYNS